MPTKKAVVEQVLVDRGWHKKNPRAYSDGTIWHHNQQERSICLPDPDPNGEYPDFFLEDFIKQNNL